ncbi:hypothetical protein [Nesterenkonia pannonica]|uniref:hypothetical protein n=1 Tax=Nesterenkonia pannonica TaxID=1548602 RepID=UPI0021649043|nr:hypothetical protein [Nesterenkonia pannonica]
MDLELQPGTESAQAMLRTIRGAGLRQMGARADAVEDLEWVSRHHWQYLEDGAVTYARVQLVYALFDAGLWDDAAELALEAAGSVLLDGEDPAAIIAYGVVALVPNLQVSAVGVGADSAGSRRCRGARGPYGPGGPILRIGVGCDHARGP